MEVAWCERVARNKLTRILQTRISQENPGRLVGVRCEPALWMAAEDKYGDSGASVGCGFLCGVDDEDVERRDGGFELEAELLLHGGEDRWAARER
jgi:hypothetical protein